MTAPSETPWSFLGGTAVGPDRTADGPEDRTNGGFVGRARELDEVSGRLSEPAGPRLVLVRGERGVGRTAFLHTVARRLRAEGTVVLALDCVPGDDGRPLLLALRLIMALEQYRQGGPVGPPGASAFQRPGTPVGEALRAAEQRDAAAMTTLLRAALAYPVPAPVVVVTDDIQHADAGSLALLREIGLPRVPPGVRLLTSAAGRGERGERGGHGGGEPDGGVPRTATVLCTRGAAREVPVRGVHTLVLSPLGPEETTAVVARRLRATPDTSLARCVRELTRGVPGAVDALLTGWTRDGAIRVADGHAFVGARTPPPALRDDDRFVTALDALSGTCRTVAGALSVLWPLGGRAAELIAASTGLSADTVGDALRGLLDAEIVEPLPGPADPPGHAAAEPAVTATQAVTATPAGTAGTGPPPPTGWRFRLPLAARAVSERLSPLERARLSATAVEAMWAQREATGGASASAGSPPAVMLPDEADAVAYLADRIAEAGSLVDPDRAVAELAAAAQRLRPDSEGRGVLRWCRAACHLVERPADRVAALGRYTKAAYNAGDHRTARTIAESILRDRADVLTPTALQDIASILTAATANDQDWRALSRLATQRWWDDSGLPAVVTVTGRALALSQLERWHEVLDLLSRTEPVWNGDAPTRAKPAYFRAVAELALGRPERFRDALALREAADLDVGHVHAFATAMFDELLSGRDLRAAEALLAAQGLAPGMLPPHSLFLWRHLAGRWDEALEPARWMLANNQTSTLAADRCLIPARAAAVLLARGRTTSARRVIDSARGRGEGPLEYSLDAVEAEILRTLGDRAGAVRTLLGGIAATDTNGQVAGTDELWAALAEVHAEEGRAGDAAACLRRLERISDRTGSGRTRLRYLLASARVLRRSGPHTARAAHADRGARPDVAAHFDHAPHGDGAGPVTPADRTACEHLREAMELARSRNQPFETAETLVAAAQAGAGPPELLHEAYELFGVTGAALLRFRTRAAMREAGITVPGRKRATAENEHLLATLIAEGLTNRQIATVLRLSEDAVANRLTRLFTRTGLRSRTEVVTAVLTHYRAHGLA